MSVISALEDRPTSHPDVRQVFHAMDEAVELEEGNSPKGKASLSELFTGGRGQNLRRVSLGVIIQCFQQITGINLITYYAVCPQHYSWLNTR